MRRLLTLTGVVALLLTLTACDVRRVPVGFAPREVRQLTHCPTESGRAVLRLQAVSPSPAKIRVWQLEVEDGRVWLGRLRVAGDEIGLGRIQAGACMSLRLAESTGRATSATFDLTSGEAGYPVVVVDGWR